MPKPRVEFLFDFGSPNAYLSHLVIPEIEKRQGVKFQYLPVLLGGVYKLTNNRSPGESLAGIKNKPQYNQLETERFIRQQRVWNHRKRGKSERFRVRGKITLLKRSRNQEPNDAVGLVEHEDLAAWPEIEPHVGASRESLAL